MIFDVVLLGVDLFAKRFQLGHVGVFVLRDVRDHDPVAGEIRAREPLDARQRDALDRPVFREVDLWPRQEPEARSRKRGGARRARRGERAFDEVLHVVAGDAAVGSAAADLREIDAQLAPEPANHRARVHRSPRVPVVRRAVRRCAVVRNAVGSSAVDRRSFDRLRRGDGRDGRLASGCRRRRGTRSSGRRGHGVTGLDARDDGSLRDFVADLDVHVCNRAGEGRRNFHRRFIGFQFDQRRVFVDDVAGFDEHRDHRHVVEAAQIRDDQIQTRHQTLTGLDLPGSSPYFAIASLTRARSIEPSFASRASAATAT